MADGSIVVDTELDPEGFQAGTARMKSAAKGLESQLKALGPALKRAVKGGSFKDYQAEADKARSSIAEMERELEALGHKPVATDQYKNMIAAMDQATYKLEALEHKQDLLKRRGVSENSTQWKNLQVDIDMAREKAEQYADAVANTEDKGTAFTPGTETAEYAELAARIEQAKQALADLEAEAANAQARLSQVPTASGMIKSAFASIGATVRSAFSGVANAVTHPIQTADRALGSLLVKAGQLPGALASLGKTAIGHFVSGLKAAASAMGRMVTGGNSMSKQFGGLIGAAKKFSLAMLGARGIYSLLRKAVTEYMSQNTALSGQMSSMFSQLGNILGPIITRIIGLVSTAIGYITALLSLLGIAGSSAVKNIDKAAGGAGGAAKELKRQLASFDDLNILNGDDDGGGGGGGGASTTDPAEVTLPDWLTMMVDKIKEGDWAGAATVLTDKLNEMVDSVDWSGIGSKIGYWLNGVLTFLATAILNFDWKNLGKHLAESVNAIIESVDWTNLGTVLSGKFRIILLTAAGFLENLDWAELAKGFSDFAQGFFDGITNAIKAVDWDKIGEGIADFLKNIDWAGIAESIFELLKSAFEGITGLIRGLLKDALDLDGDENLLEIGIKLVKKGWESLKKFVGENVTAKVTAKLSKWKDNLKKKVIDFEARLTEWKDKLRKKILDFTAKLIEWKDALKRKILDFQAKLTTWKEALKSKIIDFQAKITTWADALKSKIITFQAKMTSWVDSLKSKIISFQANMSTWKDSLLNKIINFKANFNTWKDSLSSKIINFQAKMTSWTDYLSNKVISFTAKITSWIDAILGKNKVISGFTGTSGKFGSGGVIANGTVSYWKNIPRYAGGTRNAHGSLFLAGEAGPEVLGHVNGRTEILNRSQLAATMEAAVSNGMVVIVKSVGTAILSRMTACANGIISAVLYAASVQPAVKVAPIDGPVGCGDVLAKLQDIASRITYSAPAVVGSVMPYAVAPGGADTSGIADAIEASNDELGSVIVQAVTNAASSIVNAIQQYSGGDTTIDANYVAGLTIKEINRRTRAAGTSPILGVSV